MKNVNQKLIKEEKAYTLLEYCAGAAIIAGILWGSLSYMGGGLDTFLRGIGDWATARAGEISSN